METPRDAHDARLTARCHATEHEAATKHAAIEVLPAHGPQTADEVIIGLALTTCWMLITGRRLYQQPLLHGLSADQLIDFWADDYDGAPPCH